MGKIAIGVGFLLFILVVLIGSGSQELFSAIPNMSRKGRLSLAALLCLIVGMGWFYADGGLDYLQWLFRVPPRPAAERQFVSLVEGAMQVWSTEPDRQARESKCSSQTPEFTKLADS